MRGVRAADWLCRRRIRLHARLVRAALHVPAGYTTADIAMANPDTPGDDIPGPALIDAEGQPVGFANGNVIIAGVYAPLDDPAVAAESPIPLQR